MKLRDILVEISLGAIGGEVFNLLNLTGPVDEDVFFELIDSRRLHVKFGTVSVHRLLIDSIHAVSKLAQEDTENFYKGEVDIESVEARMDDMVYDVSQQHMYFKAHAIVEVLPWPEGNRVPFHEVRTFDYYGIMKPSKAFSGNSGEVELKDPAVVKAKLAKGDVDMAELFLKSDEGPKYFKLSTYPVAKHKKKK